MIQRNRLAILALVVAIALVGAGTGANAGPTAEIDRGSGITVADHADALIEIDGNEIANHFPMEVDWTVSDDGNELDSGTLGSGDSTGTIEVSETTDVVVTVTGEATTAKIEGVEFEGTEPDVTVDWSNINSPITLTGDVDFDSVLVADTWSVEQNGNSDNADVVYGSDDEIGEIGCDDSDDVIDATIEGETSGGEHFEVVAQDVNCAGSFDSN